MQRTNTTNLTTFTLPFPDAATFVFTSSPNTTRITVPPSSSWRMPLHWHPSENNHATATAAAACERVTCISGFLGVSLSYGVRYSDNRFGSTGMAVKFAQGQRVAWNRFRKDEVPLTVDLVADHALWRNICSAVLDRAIFPKLASTPFWLRALFAVLATVPTSWRDQLLDLMLWVQLHTIFFAHDFSIYHGYVGFTWPWTAQPFGGTAPAWAWRLQIQSVYVIAKPVMATAYWAGTLFLGMKGRISSIPRIESTETRRVKYREKTLTSIDRVDQPRVA